MFSLTDGSFVSSTESTPSGTIVQKACHFALPSCHEASRQVSKAKTAPSGVFSVKAFSVTSPLSNGTPKVVTPLPFPPIHFSTTGSSSGFWQV